MFSVDMTKYTLGVCAYNFNVIYADYRTLALKVIFSKSDAMNLHVVWILIYEAYTKCGEENVCEKNIKDFCGLQSLCALYFNWLTDIWQLPEILTVF